MDKINDGGTAFPYGQKNVTARYSEGLSMRDYFAAAALQGLLASGHYTFITDREELMVAECYYDDTKKCQLVAPTDAYQVADAMIEARKEAQP